MHVRNSTCVRCCFTISTTLTNVKEIIGQVQLFKHGILCICTALSLTSSRKFRLRSHFFSRPSILSLNCVPVSSLMATFAMLCPYIVHTLLKYSHVTDITVGRREVICMIGIILLSVAVPQFQAHSYKSKKQFHISLAFGASAIWGTLNLYYSFPHFLQKKAQIALFLNGLQSQFTTGVFLGVYLCHVQRFLMPRY